MSTPLESRLPVPLTTAEANPDAEANPEEELAGRWVFDLLFDLLGGPPELDAPDSNPEADDPRQP